MAHVATVTIDHTKVAADLTDFVVAVIPNSAAGWADLYAACLEGGGDIRVYKSDDVTQLAREIVSFSASAETGEIYLKYSGTLSSSVDTDIHIYCDGSSADYAATDTYGRNAVWSAYVSVWHLKEGTSTRVDSKGTNNLTGTTRGAVTGKLGNGEDFETGNGDSLTITDASQTGLDAMSALTIQAWVKWETLTDYRPLVAKWAESSPSNQRSYALALESSNIRLWIAQSGLFDAGNGDAISNTTSLSTGVWYSIVGTYEDTTNGLKLYVNGGTPATKTPANTSSISNTSSPFYLGRASQFAGATQSLDGVLDEVRIRSTVLSADWITTEYNNQNDPSTFYAVSLVSTGTDYTQDLEEVVTGNDSIRRDTTKTHEEAGTVNDTIIKGKASRYTENVTGSDSIATLNVKLKAVLEAVGVNDTIARAITKNITEAATAADTLVKDITKAFSELVETIASATALTATYVQVLIETVTTSDTISKLVGYARAFTETVTANDYFRIALNGINALWSDIYTDTADAWQELYTDTTDAWSDKYIDN